MEVSNSFKLGSQEILISQDQSSSRFAKKLTFFVSLIILFTFIMGSIVSVFSIMKHNVESQSLSANPTKAIQSVCHLFSYGYFEFYDTSKDSNSRPRHYSDLCIKSITSLHSQHNYSNKINPSMIFHLSLQVSISQIKNLQNEPNLEEGCKKLIIESESQLNKSLTLMGVDPDYSILRDWKLVNDMSSWINNATVDLETCLVGFKEKKFGRIMELNKVELKIKRTKEYLEHSLEILGNVDYIYEMFYPPIGSWPGKEGSETSAKYK
ncbi:hypothetical protein Leryth_014228 [Lithospermum erythrorhizon]|nr:hypothetical protein Leryth_014228 [Lithospermum erythrorhizon]